MEFSGHPARAVGFEERSDDVPRAGLHAPPGRLDAELAASRRALLFGLLT